MKQGCNYKQLTGYCQVRTAYCAVNRAFYVSCRDAFALKVGFSMTSRGVFGGWQASLTDTLRCVSHKVFTWLPSVASHTGQQYLCYAVNGLNKHVAVSATLTFATPPAAYANPLRCCDAASRLHNGGEVAQFLHKTSYALCDASLLSHTAVAALRVA